MATPPDSPIGFGRRRTMTASSAAHSVASATQGITHAAGDILRHEAPLSFSSAAGISVSRAPTITEIRRGSFGRDGWQPPHEQGYSRAKRKPTARALRPPSPVFDDENAGTNPFDSSAEGEFDEKQLESVIPVERPRKGSEPDFQGVIHSEQGTASPESITRDTHAPSDEGSQPVIPWTTSAAIGFKAFLKWTITPFGFFVVLYGLNVVAWGGMLFLLLCNASPAMCWAPAPSAEAEIRRAPAAELQFLSTQPRVFNCGSFNSPRRIWIEIDSQILNALFCVTGFGLAPWRFRDLYYLLRYRFSTRSAGLERKMYGLQVLAGIHRTWFRLPGSSTLDQMSLAGYERNLAPPTINSPGVEIRGPLPPSREPGEPLTGVRASETAVWKMDFFVWCNVWNTLFQVCLCFFMWHFNRYDRPSWATGLFIGLACIVAAAGGMMSFVEGKRVKRVEGVSKPRGVMPDDLEGMAMQETPIAGSQGEKCTRP